MPAGTLGPILEGMRDQSNKVANTERLFGADFSARITAPDTETDTEAYQSPAQHETALDRLTLTVLSPILPSSSTTRDEFVHYGKSALKTGALFFPGAAGCATTAFVSGLDHMRTGETTTEKVLDFALGAVQGVAARQILHATGKLNLNVASKGLTMGVTTRLAETVLDRHTYLNPKTGEFSFELGKERTLATCFSSEALLADIVVFGAAHSLAAKINADTGNILKKSPFWSTVLTGGTFGASSGSYHELMRQTQNKEAFDPTQVVLRGLLQAGVDSVAAMPGGYRSDAIFRQHVRDAVEVQGQKLEQLRDIINSGLAPQRPEYAFALAGFGNIGLTPQMELRSHAFAVTTEPGTGGGARFRSGNGITPQEWQSKVSEWSKLPESDKVSLLAHLHRSPEAQRLSLWKAALKDNSEQVRFTAATTLDALPEGQRLTAWRDAVHSSDYIVRLGALSSISDLPAKHRQSAIAHTLEQGALLYPPAGTSPWYVRGSKDFWQNFSGASPPEWMPKHLVERFSRTPASLVVEAIGAIPSGDRLRLWQECLNDNRTRSAAIGNLKVLPESERAQAWDTVDKQVTWKMRPYQNDGYGEKLVAQIGVLPEGKSRIAAWDKAVQNHAPFEKEAIISALLSLPEATRYSKWKELLEVVSSRNYSMTHVTGSIEGLPPEVRLEAFSLAASKMLPVQAADQPYPYTKEISSDKKIPWAEQLRHHYVRQHVLDLASAINKIPVAQKIEAFELMVKHYPTDALWRCLDGLSDKSGIDAQHIGRAARVLLESGSPELIEALSISIPLWRMQELPAGDGKKAMVDFFTEVSKAGPQNAKYLREWWDETALPQSDAEYEMWDGKSVLPMREHLAGAVDLKVLTTILFGSDGETAKIGQRLASENAFFLRNIARCTGHTANAEEMATVARAADHWLTTGDMLGSVRTALDNVSAAHGEERSGALSDFMRILALQTKASDVPKLYTMLLDCSVNPSSNEGQRLVAMRAACALRDLNPNEFQRAYVAPTEELLRSSTQLYTWKLATCARLGLMERTGELEPGTIQFPDLRMPPIKLEQKEQVTVRQQAESALFDSHRLMGLMGSGPLGKLFPSIFGLHESDNGIVGRPQHGGHEFPIDVHSIQVVENVRQQPEFAMLTEKDQVNVLWAALLHDVGKQAGRADPGHEYVSANLGWGVLTSLGYSAARTQRIVNLITRHREASFDPGLKGSERLKHPEALDDLATFYRHPSSAAQLRILNESDIRAINSSQSYWKEDVAKELDSVRALIANRGQELNHHSLPLLTTHLPRGFRLQVAPESFALLVHVSNDVGGTFLRQLAVIESPQYSASTSLVTKSHQHLYYNKGGLVAILSAPPEQISQSHRTNLGTGVSVDWKRHVELTKDWLEAEGTGEKFATEVNRDLRKLGFGTSAEPLSALTDARSQLAQFDNLDELLASSAPLQLKEGALIIVKAMTRDDTGAPSKQHNEVKVNNPTLTGFGIIRKNMPVHFEAMTETQAKALLGTNNLPHWLVLGPKPAEGVIHISELLWNEAQRRNLPIVVLDP